jgi:hypothetical protein
MDSIRIGDVVIVRGGFGHEEPQQVEVLGVDEKNGRPLIDYVDNQGRSRWAYFDQVTLIREDAA